MQHINNNIERSEIETFSVHYFEELQDIRSILKVSERDIQTFIGVSLCDQENPIHWRHCSKK